MRDDSDLLQIRWDLLIQRLGITNQAPRVR